METSTTYQVSLCMSSKILSAKEITDKLEIQPSMSHEKGSPFNKRNPKGKLRPISSWILNSSLEGVDSLEAHIEHLISIIESKFNDFEQLVPDCKIEIYCSFFASDVTHEGTITLSSVLLKRLTAIPLDILIVLYPPQVEQI